MNQVLLAAPTTGPSAASCRWGNVESEVFMIFAPFNFNIVIAIVIVIADRPLRLGTITFPTHRVMITQVLLLRILRTLSMDSG